MSEEPPRQPAPRRIALLAGAVGYLVGAAAMIWAILRSPSSTAAIGFFFVPFYALVPGTIALVLGGTGAYAWQWWQAPGRQWSASVATTVAVFFVLLGASGTYVAENLRVTRAVGQVAQMDATELSTYFRSGSLREDKFVLGAAALNVAADGALLDAIAHLGDESLHSGMGSLFPVLGENRRGLAVMRLVARHDNTDSETLSWLSQSPDDYVLGDVAGNPKTPVPVLRRLHAKGGYLIEWGLARNWRSPVEILRELASSDDQYTRAGVARNRAAPPDALDRLGEDPIWHVRRDVAGNQAASEQQRERLATDANEHVRRAAARSLTGR